MCAFQDWTYSDYLRDLVWIGLIQRFGGNATDYEKVCPIYKGCKTGGGWGGGYGYSEVIRSRSARPDAGGWMSQVLQERVVDRTPAHIEHTIKQKLWDVVVYGVIDRGTPFLQLVCCDARKHILQRAARRSTACTPSAKSGSSTAETGRSHPWSERTWYVPSHPFHG